MAPLDPDLSVEAQGKRERIKEVQITNVYNDNNEIIQKYTSSGFLVIQETYDYDKNSKIIKKVLLIV